MLINGRVFLLTVIVIGALIGTVVWIKGQGKDYGSQEVKEEKVFNPSLLSWQKVETNVPWSPRDSHALVVYQDKMWLFGGLNGEGFVISPGVVGYNEAPHFSDIWSSEDGRNWTLLKDKAAWGKRRSIQAVVFQDKIWMIPGWGPRTGLKREIWSSEDGVNWQLEVSSAPWPAREGHQLVVFKNRLWLLGGVDYDKRETKNDVWYSEDGINWFEATSSAPWSSRWDHGAAVFKDKLWLIGGMDLKDNVFGDVWVSENGKDWLLLENNPPFSKRQGHELVVFQDRIWIVGRFNSSQEGGKNDVWFSDNGINWQKAKKDPPWSGREDHTAVVFQDKIWVLGGMTTDWVWKNDVWYSTLADK